ncbi:MAG TPA: MarR family transcriptional regulator [Jatrophihabitantaceae bacterium]|jgi:DNA-binding MarR family transcriptional regulator|nr:MarR family transcriptional regulator [Jatrophihabitantaceae bacterium]
MKPESGNEAVDAILHAAHRIRTRFDADLRSIGLSLPSYKVLKTLAADGQSMVAISEVLRVSPRTVTDLVDTLVARELVERCQHASDRRVTVVCLTGKGAQTLAQGRQLAEQNHARAVSALSAAEQRTVQQLLERVCSPNSTSQ